MLKEDLIHILRAARNIWEASDIPADAPICVIGSQSILFYHREDELPPTLVESVEVDLFLYDRPDIETSDIVSGAIGEGSRFHERFGCYADGIDPANITLPVHWLDRARRMPIDLHDGTKAVVVAITPEDLVASKLVANRPKDREYVRACKEFNLLDGQLLHRAIYDLPRSFDECQTLLVRYEHIGPTRGPHR